MPGENDDASGRQPADGAARGKGGDSSPLLILSVVDGDRKRGRGGLRPAVASGNPKPSVEDQALVRAPAGDYWAMDFNMNCSLRLSFQ